MVILSIYGVVLLIVFVTVHDSGNPSRRVIASGIGIASLRILRVEAITIGELANSYFSP
jgi:hypothetical protein